jgi:hypothetical protein
MGAIQQGVNQLLGTAAIAAKFSPGLETEREIKNIDKQIEISSKKVTSQTDYLKQMKDTLSADDLIKQLEISSEQNNKITELMKRKFELKPNLGTYTSYSTAAGLSGLSEKQLNVAKGAQQTAQQKAQQKAQEQLEQKQRFEKFVEMFTEGGKYK